MDIADKDKAMDVVKSMHLKAAPKGVRNIAWCHSAGRSLRLAWKNHDPALIYTNGGTATGLAFGLILGAYPAGWLTKEIIKKTIACTKACKRGADRCVHACTEKIKAEARLRRAKKQALRESLASEKARKQAEKAEKIRSKVQAFKADREVSWQMRMQRMVSGERKKSSKLGEVEMAGKTVADGAVDVAAMRSRPLGQIREHAAGSGSFNHELEAGHHDDRAGSSAQHAGMFQDMRHASSGQTEYHPADSRQASETVEREHKGTSSLFPGDRQRSDQLAPDAKTQRSGGGSRIIPSWMFRGGSRMNSAEPPPRPVGKDAEENPPPSPGGKNAGGSRESADRPVPPLWQGPGR